MMKSWKNVFCLIGIVLATNLCPWGVWAQAKSTGTISVAQIEAEPGTQVDVPVTVTGFQDFAMFQFSFQYNPEPIIYIDVVNRHPALDGQTFLYGADQENGTIGVTFSGSDSGHTIPDGGVLFSLRFNFCADPLNCAQNDSRSEIIFDMSGDNYLAKPDFSSISLTFSDGSIYADPPLRILTLETVGSGSVAVDGSPYTEPIVVEEGTGLGLTATPSEDWMFQGWSGDLGGSENPTTITMDGHKDVTATFVPEEVIQYTITATAGANGSITPSGDVTVNKGDDQSFTITPNAGYHIDDVLVDGTSVGSVSEYTFTNVTDDHTIHATFAINQYTIAVSASPGAGGTASGGGTYNHGATVNLSASPNAGYNFVNWTEDGSEVSTDPAYSFTATASRTLVANFAEITYTLTFDVEDAAGNPISGATITLNGTTNPAGNYVFSGLAAGQYDYTVAKTNYQDYTGNVSVNDDTAVDVTLQLLTYTVTFGVTVGNGSLAATTDGTPISSGEAVDHGSDLLFTATPDAGYLVKEWKLNGSVVTDHTETTLALDAIDDDVNVTVAFEEIPPDMYTLTVTIAGSGSVNVNGDSYTEPVTVVEGTVLNLEAIAAEWWDFDEWTGDVSKNGNTLVVTMNADREITATFTRQQFTLTINTSGNGSVKVDGTTYTDVLTINGGETVALLAEPDPYWQFDNWAGDLSGDENPKDLLINGHKEVTAHFSLPEYTLTVNIIGNGDVTIGGDGYTVPVTVAAGTTLNLEALPDAGHEFAGWSGDTVYLDHPDARRVTLTMPPYNIDLTAQFIEDDDTYVNPELTHGRKAIFRTYPNPTQGLLVIEAEHMVLSAPIEVNLYSLCGNLVMSTSLLAQEKQLIDISGLRPGLYMLEIRLPEKNSVHRIMKQ